ncbi:AtrD, ABC-transporter [Pseudomassariella vexata]|uniref:AtrD, ABC-transporter n=1 Tax=Pseudomassariella vexata TaxID=1141098 RepID=A0A1Y2EF77_9PEZI|nr:AtrD, ABC-transporter [Pseudomassariella vexata]ORY70232.1 AtrD, ABC-transporter [Pseudomassariella vexata]
MEAIAKDALERWLATLSKADPDARLGVSFRNLCAYGFTSSTDYQATVGSYVLAVVAVLGRMLGWRRRRKVDILHGFDGLVRSGEMLLVLGRPGSGCTTMLKALAGDTHGFHLCAGSDINYQGISFDSLHHDCEGAAIYQAELDVHFPELTLGQTLGFAAAARTGRKHEGSSQDSSSSEFESLPPSQLAASIFGLAGSMQTMMGNEMMRGVSGGEKKRTSIAEAFMAGVPIQVWDNTTRGLDSLTALEVITTLKRAATVRGASVMVSVYQASQAIYSQFDKVTLLYEGRQVYFGPVDQAVRFFERLGFDKSERHTTADFLTSLTNPAERVHVVRDGFEDRVPRSAAEFADAWTKSPERQGLIDSIAAYNAEYPLGQEAVRRYHSSKATALGYNRTSPYSISTWRQVSVCVRRGFNRLRNNYVPVVSGVIGNTVVAIIISSVFYSLSETTDSFYRRAVLIFYSIVINAGISAFEVLTMWAARPIVEKHHKYKFYHPFVESTASMICDLPNKIFTSIGFNLSIYFMTNLRRTPGGFFTFYLFSFTCLVTMSMFFRMVGSLSRTIEQSMAPVANLMLLFIIYAGFVIPAKYMHPWLGWIRWINPIGYAYESLMINEFWGRMYSCSTMVPSGPAYTQVSPTERVCSAVGSIPGEDYVRGERYLEVQYGYVQSHLWRNFGILLAMMIVFCFIHLLAVEFIPAQRSKGEILLFRRGHTASDRLVVVGDEEKASAAPDVPVRSDVKEETELVAGHKSGIFDNLQKQTAVFHWDDISYDIEVKHGKKRILDDVDGWVKPGTLTALMGATGAGKTTLLDVLACRTSIGVVSGAAYIDGRPRDSSFQRKTGYVQQSDIHLPTATVREALAFSALLRQPRSATKVEKLEYVEHVLRALDMELYADAVVGVPGEGLNVEQRKRLSIAIEMAAKPELLLFLDEPTSGLDSQTAWSICTLLRRLADNGQAILCTIHQPSSQLFQMFDQLLLLERGGRTLYFGDIGRQAVGLVQYFEDLGARSCGEGENPAEWILDVTGANRTSKPDIDWSVKWRNGPRRRELKRQLAEMKEELSAKPDSRPARLHDEYAGSLISQLLLVTHRIFQEYWRDPVYLYSKVALSAGVAFFNGFSLFMAPLDIQGIVNILFSIFLLTSIFNNVDQQIIPRFIRGRQLFEARERPSKTYSWVAFVASNVLVELFWQTVTSVLLFVVWYYPTGLWRNEDPSFSRTERGGLMFGLLWIFCLFMSTLSQAIAAGIEHAETAVNMAQLVSSLWLIFCGVLVPPSQLPGFWIFMYRVAPLTYLVGAMTSASIGNTVMTCSPYELLRFDAPPGQTCGQYMAQYLSYPGVSGSLINPDATEQCLYCPLRQTNAFLATMGIDVDDRWRDFGLQFVYVAFNITATFVLYWLVRVPKKKTNTAGY